MGSDFNQRFDIKTGLEEARRRFMNRIENEIFRRFLSGTDFDERDRVWLITHPLQCWAKGCSTTSILCWLFWGLISTDFSKQ